MENAKQGMVPDDSLIEYVIGGIPDAVENKTILYGAVSIDYFKLKLGLYERIITDRYLLPLIDDQVDRLRGKVFFTTLDLRSGFFRVPIEDSSIKYILNLSHLGLVTVRYTVWFMKLTTRIPAINKSCVP